MLPKATEEPRLQDVGGSLPPEEQKPVRPHPSEPGTAALVTQVYQNSKKASHAQREGVVRNGGRAIGLCIAPKMCTGLRPGPGHGSAEPRTLGLETVRMGLASGHREGILRKRAGL